MICPVCGEEFDCNNISDLFMSHVRYVHKIKKSKDFYDVFIKSNSDGICGVCGNETKFQGLKRGYGHFCSRKCYYKDDVHVKKRKQTIENKYGSMEDFIENTKMIKKKKYGDENYNNSSQQVATMKDRYGEDYMKKFHEKNKKKNQKKYNCDYPLQDSRIYEKTKISKSNRVISNIQKKLPNGYIIVKKDHSGQSLFHILCQRCNSISIFNRKPLEYRLNHNMEICYNCLPKDLKTSSMERQIREYVESTLGQKTISRFTKDGNEIDVYVPDKNFGIEMNGLYYHSDLFKTKDYHKNKTDYFRTKGIKIIHVYEDEWLEKSDLIKSIINSFLDVNIQRIFGRKTVVKPVDKMSEREFLEKNHLQGYVPSKHAFGLYLEDRLVSCITLGIPRFRNKIHDYELLRFCNLLNTKVIGGFSKMWKYAVAELSIDSAISYCDKRFFTGEIYTKCGFSLDRETQPNYYWCYGNQRFNRFKFRKSELSDKTLTEDEQMRYNKYQKIYNCGNNVFIWRKDGKEKE